MKGLEHLFLGVEATVFTTFNSSSSLNNFYFFLLLRSITLVIIRFYFIFYFSLFGQGAQSRVNWTFGPEVTLALEGLLWVHACVRTPKALRIWTPAGMGVQWPCLITAHLSAELVILKQERQMLSLSYGFTSASSPDTPLALFLPALIYESCAIFSTTQMTLWKIINRVLSLKEQSSDSGRMP